MDDEVPGNVSADTDVVRPADMLLPQEQSGKSVDNPAAFPLLVKLLSLPYLVHGV